MEKLKFQIPQAGASPELLNMGGKDAQGNEYQADQRSLLYNGKRILPVMGELHYSRLEPESWKEAILKMQAGGVNILATYVFWNHHEERKGEWDFSGCRDLRGFLQTCQDVGMKVWLRIGPWDHGEVRNGGFPDYVQYADDFETRTDDPVYLELVRVFFGKIAEQVEGMMCGDGGPVIGIQLENEYGHCGGPADSAEKQRHLKTLYRMARDAGMVTPYYSATAWGGATTIDETLQVLSGYVDAPWDDSVEALPPLENYLFIPYRDDANTGSDFHQVKVPGVGIRTDYPYLTAELGGGLQSTSHRRVHTTGADHAGHIVTVLGAGANLIGYYMYHGGINPDGRYSFLNEARLSGGNTNVPKKSYDFDACVNEAGLLSEGYGVLKKYHHMVTAFGEELAGAELVLPDSLPQSAADAETVRAALRWNHSTNTGFLFVNNHVRHLAMQEHPDVTFAIALPDGSRILLEHIEIAPDECMVLPIHLQTEAVLIRKTNASLLGKIGKRVFLYRDGEAVIEAEGDCSYLTVLTQEEADRSFVFSDGLYVTEDADCCIIEEDGRKKLISQRGQRIRIYREDGSMEELCAEPGEAQLRAAKELKAEFSLTREEFDKNGRLRKRFYRVEMENLEAVDGNQIYLNVDYLGDRAEVYAEGRLIDDWFTTGMPWNIALRRFGYPKQLEICIVDSAHTLPSRFGEKVYYDLPVQAGCEMRAVSLKAEFLLPLGQDSAGH